MARMPGFCVMPEELEDKQRGAAAGACWLIVIGSAGGFTRRLRDHSVLPCWSDSWSPDRRG